MMKEGRKVKVMMSGKTRGFVSKRLIPIKYAYQDNGQGVYFKNV
jgi:hypothetical protein